MNNIRRKFTDERSLEVFKEIFPKATIEYGDGFLGADKQMKFSMRGRTSLSMYPIEGTREYRIFEFRLLHNSLAFTGDPVGALNFLDRWYKG